MPDTHVHLAFTHFLTVYTAPSMSHYLNQTSKVILDKYKGDLDNLRKEAKHDPVKERELVKAFKVYMCVHCYVVMLPSHTAPLYLLSSCLRNAGSKLPVLPIFSCKRMRSNQNFLILAGLCRGCNHDPHHEVLLCLTHHTIRRVWQHTWGLLFTMLCRELASMQSVLKVRKGLRGPFVLT